MPHQITVTGNTGPGRALTAVTIPNVTGIDFQLNDRRLFITTDQAAGDNIKEFDLNTITTVTFSIAGGNYSVTVS
jgi:hypothetical protein